ncbi:hypothetical protein GGF46_002541 [Coemansia sp. RSA 552]|nr:hypothetical protein GGF46_002541 [Coemansia sp. RSA 552]
MASLQSRIKRPFQDVAVSDDNEVDTAQFLDAAEGVVMLFDILESKAFYPVKTDMTTNIEKVRTKHAKDPAAFSTLQKIILDDVRIKDRTATQGLLWLKRGLEFTAMGLEMNMGTPAAELSESFTKAYEVTLQKYHGFVVRNMFGLAMKVCPTRKSFYEKIGGGEDEATVIAQLREWAEALQKLLNLLNKFYAAGAYDKGL